MSEPVEKEEVEQILGYEITDSQFETALGYAQRMQDYIYKTDNRPVVLQHWYLVKLTEEYVRMLSFSEYTMDLCSIQREKPENQDKKTNSFA